VAAPWLRTESRPTCDTVRSGFGSDADLLSHVQPIRGNAGSRCRSWGDSASSVVESLMAASGNASQRTGGTPRCLWHQRDDGPHAPAVPRRKLLYLDAHSHSRVRAKSMGSRADLVVNSASERTTV